MSKSKLLFVLLLGFSLMGVMCGSDDSDDPAVDNSPKARVVNNTGCTLTNVRYGGTNWGTIGSYATSAYLAISGSHRAEFNASGSSCWTPYLDAPEIGKTYTVYVNYTSGISCSGCNFTLSLTED